jgi:hypothetical protein
LKVFAPQLVKANSIALSEPWLLGGFVIVGQFVTHLVSPLKLVNVWFTGQVQASCDIEPEELVKPAGQLAHCEVPPVP